jgi:hypothetical protein
MAEIPKEILKSLHMVGSLRMKPDYAIELAEIASVSSLVEHQLVVAFSAITETPYAIASKAIHSMANAHARIKAIRSMAADFSPSEDFRWQLSDILNDLMDLGKRRARYVHGYWVVRGDGDVQLVNHQLGDHDPNYTRSVALDELKDLVSDLLIMSARLGQLVKPLLPPPSLPENMLQRRLRPRRSRPTDTSPSEPKRPQDA